MTSAVEALVPMKDPDRAKSRLAPHLSAAERSSLARCMAQDVLSVLSQVVGLKTNMVTGHPNAKRIAAQFKVHTMPDRGSGETAVIHGATQDLLRQGATGSLVIPADVPLVTLEEVAQVLAAAAGRCAVLVPSCSGRGSNAVLRMPPDLFPLQFGDDSFEPHLARARETGARCSVLKLPGLGLDIDEVEDLRALLSRPGRTRTHAFLASSGVAGRIQVHERV